MADEVTLTRAEILTMNNAILAMANVKGDGKFTYAVSLSRRGIKDVVEALQETNQSGEGFKTYEEARIVLCREYAAKTERDAPRMTDGKFDIDPARRARFEVAIRELQDEHREGIEEEEKRREAFNELLKEEAVVKLHRICLDDMPELTIAQMDALLPMIREKDEPKLKAVK